MSGIAILVIDSDAWSAHALAGELRDFDFVRSADVAAGLDVSTALRSGPDVVLFNHHSDRPGDLLACLAAKLYAPTATAVALAAAGPSVKFVRQWNQQHDCLQSVLEKPLQPGQLQDVLRELAQRRSLEHALRARAEHLAGLVPDGAAQALRGEEEIFEAAVLFTDIRRSSELVTSQPARAFFRVLNESLSAQSVRVRACQGAVVKYTGDGMMAIFRGMGRAHLAMRCALQLAEAGAQEPVGFGIGVADGLVLAGLVGDFQSAGQRQLYDVIGATAHLAARLCAQAQPGQVVATRAVHKASRLPAAGESLGAQKVRGFPAPVECVALRAAPLQVSDSGRVS